MRDLITQLYLEHCLTGEQWRRLLTEYTEDDRAYAAGLARLITDAQFGKNIYTRGIIEFSNVCKNDCLYCGIRRSNAKIERYRMTPEEILACCETGYELGLRTFVLQSGEDRAVSAAKLAEIVKSIKKQYPDCAVTLSVGELAESSLALLKQAGADRYLLRHETADPAHYYMLHPTTMSYKHRIKTLYTLKKLGYQTGAGMMVGSPYQTPDCLVADMLFLQSFQPEMVGIGPFIPQQDTPFRDKEKGSLTLTLFLLSLTRLMLPRVLLPATTALGTLQPDGREQGVMAGCNVVMPNLSPPRERKLYMLYNYKLGSTSNASDSMADLQKRMSAIGYTLSVERGDYHP